MERRHQQNLSNQRQRVLDWDGAAHRTARKSWQCALLCSCFMSVPFGGRTWLETKHFRFLTIRENLQVESEFEMIQNGESFCAVDAAGSSALMMAKHSWSRKKCLRACWEEKRSYHLINFSVIYKWAWQLIIGSLNSNDVFVVLFWSRQKEWSWCAKEDDPFWRAVDFGMYMLMCKEKVQNNCHFPEILMCGGILPEQSTQSPW